jgi:hypothetical protein
VPSYSVRIGEDIKSSPQPEAAANRPKAPAVTNRPLGAKARKMFGLLALLSAVLVVINLLSWRGVFWAAWPLLAFAVLTAMIWVRNQNRVDRGIAALGVVGLGMIAINLLSWHGIFWAIWPVLGLAAAAGVRWVMRN